MFPALQLPDSTVRRGHIVDESDGKGLLYGLPIGQSLFLGCPVFLVGSNGLRGVVENFKMWLSLLVSHEKVLKNGQSLG